MSQECDLPLAAALAKTVHEDDNRRTAVSVGVVSRDLDAVGGREVDFAPLVRGNVPVGAAELEGLAVLSHERGRSAVFAPHGFPPSHIAFGAEFGVLERTHFVEHEEEAARFVDAGKCGAGRSEEVEEAKR